MYTFNQPSSERRIPYLNQSFRSLNKSIRHRSQEKFNENKMALLVFIIIIAVSFYLLILFIKKFATGEFYLSDDPFEDEKAKYKRENNIPNYSFNYTFTYDEKKFDDSEYILNSKYKKYFSYFNLNENSPKKNSEINNLYNLFKFNKKGENSPILVDYCSSLPRFPEYAEKNHKCFKRGEIIAKIDSKKNLKCLDISGILYEDKNFYLRLSLLNKQYNQIELFVFKEIDVVKETKINDNMKHNLMFYSTKENKMNLRYCSNELGLIGEKYASLPKEYVPILEISWPEKHQYFCVKDVKLIYD